MKFKTQNGWTIEKMIARICSKNNGYRSFSEGHSCAYRGEGGNACAVGCFIPDDKYEPRMEGDTSGTVIYRFGLHEFMPLNLAGMSELQRVHDNAGFRENVRDLMCNWVKENVEDAA